MFSISGLLKVSAIVSAFLTSANAISNVTRSGRYLYNSDGSRFYIKGVAYQEQGAVDENSAFLEPSSFIDPLSSGTNCTRDLPFLQQLGVNTIRVYSVNSSLDHDDCMSTFSSAGIYTIIDLSLPLTGSISRTSPAWTTDLLDEYIETINTFSKYDNVLAYNVGNEVVSGLNESAAITFVKAAARDVKAYLSSKSLSTLVGYAAIDGSDDFIGPISNYLSCDPSNSNSGSTAIDIFGLNNYRWCGDSSFDSAYSGVEALFSGYNVVAYFSEFGCNDPSPRVWTEVGSLFSSQMSDVWSGGLAFSYFPAESAQGQFGMVTINSDNSVTTSTDFDNLKTQLGQVSPPNSPSSGSSSSSFPSCPAENSTFLASTSLPPTPVDSACSCLATSVSCQFTPTQDPDAVVGDLLNQACGLLGEQGGSCDDIAANGTTGSYGSVSPCDASTKLAYVFSLYYEKTNKASTSCDFSGNATISRSNSLSAPSAASSCLASASGTSVPVLASSASGTATGAGSGSSSTASSGSGNSSGAVATADMGAGLRGLVAVIGMTVMSGWWVLA
ncbi:uncharacterized protein STEHIDRAFT_117496 [Stereum hirsutum FP-91666 SS1]|uniref:uncharacterized protein n=1 Tax=Stereum hirsutum (strain FP-91666) TaxID=721885 RepID=UPI00044101AA|nr:uncharacterized protein STEHIDRAFT_117496 [Stereum hirsutum FP-91666 SS1]EIM92490.1 hypothetical protein STEHIDRAFT_117496 [Stereum hirsutum FP-91666 SS1]